MTEMVTLTRDKFAIVDDEDYFWIRQYKWQFGGGGYPMRGVNLGNRNFITVYMHRLILRAQPGECVDHKNGDTLDNRRCNLRIATRTQNVWNRGKMKTKNSSPLASKFIGVALDKSRNRWKARIQTNGKLLNLGSFETEEEAARAYDYKALELRGEFARLNFSVPV